MIPVREEIRALARLAAPIAMAQVGLNALALVDTAIVGNDSTLDFEAATLGRSVFFTVASVGLGVGMALEPIASQAVASGEQGRAWVAFRRTLRAVAYQWPVAVVLAFGLTFLLPLLRVADAEVRGARLFMLGNVPGLYFFVAFIAGKTFLQAHGRTRPLLVGAVVANVVNWAVCNVLVRGDACLRDWHLPALGLPHLGAFGAGVASSVASGVLFLWTLVAARQHRGDDPRSEDGPSVKRILELGIPMGLQLLAEIGAFTFAALLAAWFGPSQVGAYQVALMLASVTFMGAMGVSGATAVRVGRAVGEGRSARNAGLSGIGMGASVMLVGVAAFTLVPRTLVGFFTHDEAVLDLGSKLLRIAAVFQLFDGVQVVAAGALRGAGDVRYPFVANVVAHWGMGLPVALGLAFGLHWGALGLFCGLTVGLVAVSFGLGLRFFHVSKKLIERV